MISVTRRIYNKRIQSLRELTICMQLTVKLKEKILTEFLNVCIFVMEDPEEKLERFLNFYMFISEEIFHKLEQILRKEWNPRK